MIESLCFFIYFFKKSSSAETNVLKFCVLSKYANT